VKPALDLRRERQFDGFDGKTSGPQGKEKPPTRTFRFWAGFVTQEKQMT
jgi:hypothetical protein